MWCIMDRVAGKGWAIQTKHSQVRICSRQILSEVSTVVKASWSSCDQLIWAAIIIRNWICIPLAGDHRFKLICYLPSSPNVIALMFPLDTLQNETQSWCSRCEITECCTTKHNLSSKWMSFNKRGARIIIPPKVGVCLCVSKFTGNQI